jgi:hypothetical protein
MRDVVFLAITVGFFAVAGLFVRGCARIVGPDDPSLGRGDPSPDDLAAADDPDVSLKAVPR